MNCVNANNPEKCNNTKSAAKQGNARERPDAAARYTVKGSEGLCEEISVKTKTVIKTLLWSGMKNLPLLFIYSIQRIL